MLVSGLRHDSDHELVSLNAGDGYLVILSLQLILILLEMTSNQNRFCRDTNIIVSFPMRVRFVVSGIIQTDSLVVEIQKILHMALLSRISN